MFEVGHYSHAGNKRTLNEDSYDIDAGLGIACVVDGMGGTNAGDVASAFVREHLRKCLLQGDSPSQALKNTGQSLRIQRPQQGTAPSGASAALVRFTASDLNLAWLGTCRVFFHDGTRCHAVSDQSAAPEGSPPAPATAIQALGVTTSDKLHIASATLNWKRAQAVLLCSDGLLEDCTLETLQNVMVNPQLCAQEAVDQIMISALKGAALNNLTAVLIRRV